MLLALLLPAAAICPVITQAADAWPYQSATLLTEMGDPRNDVDYLWTQARSCANTQATSSQGNLCADGSYGMLDDTVSTTLSCTQSRNGRIASGTYRDNVYNDVSCDGDASYTTWSNTWTGMHIDLSSDPSIDPPMASWNRSSIESSDQSMDSNGVWSQHATLSDVASGTTTWQDGQRHNWLVYQSWTETDSQYIANTTLRSESTLWSQDGCTISSSSIQSDRGSLAAQVDTLITIQSGAMDVHISTAGCFSDTVYNTADYLPGTDAVPTPYVYSLQNGHWGMVQAADWQAVTGDVDSDGWPTTVDIDDNDAQVGLCDWCQADADGDGAGGGDVVPLTGECPQGYVPRGGDCDDSDATIHPFATEIDGDRIDQDCDPTTDIPAILDHDGDGFNEDIDCNDADPAIFPGAIEICNDQDDDCDGTIDRQAVDAQPFYADADADGFGVASNVVYACTLPLDYSDNAEDCDDRRPDIFPGAPESCDGLDHDCDGAINEADSINALTFYQDQDGDSFGDAAAPVQACFRSPSLSANNRDCNDQDAAISPMAQEVCGGGDEDCDGLVDDADPNSMGKTPWYLDADSDGFAGPAFTLACAQPVASFSSVSDCNDGVAAIHPGASEVCNGADDDCDGGVDQGAVDALPFYGDVDGDGYGNAADIKASCSRPNGYVSSASDCDDQNAAISPAAQEICGGGDENCNGLVDDNDSDVAGQQTWFADADADGFGDVATVQMACVQPVGFSADASDCNDQDASVSAVSDWYQDGDGDGYGSESTVSACGQPVGYVDLSGDCDDQDAGRSPAVPEVSDDGIDQDCTGTDLEELGIETVVDTGTVVGSGGIFGEDMGAGKSSVTSCGGCSSNPSSAYLVIPALFLLRRRRVA